VGVIGTGPIGQAVAERLAAGAIPGLSVGAILTLGPDPAPSFRHAATIDELLDSAIVVEAASHEAVREYGERVLAAGVDFLCVSVGALGDAALREGLLQAAEAGGSRLVIPSGAVGALDLLRSALETGLDEVVVEQRKPATSVLPADEAARLSEPQTVFDGTVGEVVRLYPKTTNVAAAVALAGLGFDRTRARVIADPTISANQVVLTGRGDFGDFRLDLRNVPTANPKTSTIAAASVLAALRLYTGKPF
jgi:aspartate dehydrogenase